MYAILIDGSRAVAYGLLRGWDDGYTTPMLGVAVRSHSRGRGFGRLMMEALHAEARRRGAELVKLRVDRGNMVARRLYEAMAYTYQGEERGELLMVKRLGEPAPHVLSDLDAT